MDFLNASWRKLIMANYAIDKSVLAPFLPTGTDIDLWNNTCYISLVGFMFLNTKLLGISIPFHRNFEEVNLRFYVRRKENNEIKRGVVFIKEIVPKPALTMVANVIYKEHYETLPMKHTWKLMPDNLFVKYEFYKKAWQSLEIICKPKPIQLEQGTIEEFISEHYWGYSKSMNQSTIEYGVEHPKWDVYETISYKINVDFEKVYGKSFAFLNQQKPNSVFLAEGSDVIVRTKRKL